MRDRSARFRGLCFALVSGCLLAGCATGEPQRGERAALSVEPSVTAYRHALAMAEDGRDVESAPQANRSGETAQRIDVLHADVSLRFEMAPAVIHGQVSYRCAVETRDVALIRLSIPGIEVTAAGISRDDRQLRTTFEGDRDVLVLAPAHPLSYPDTIDVGLSFRVRGDDSLSDVHFVDPQGNDPALPTEIWSEGPAWIPAWDQSADRMTFDLRLTVPDSLLTLASGTLSDQYDSGEGYRTDRWVVDPGQDADHVGFSIGRFSLVGDEYVSPVGKRLPLVYAVPPGREAIVDDVFAPTPQMIGVLERRTAVAYPFADYRQVVVSGRSSLARATAGMSLLSEPILRDERALLDDTGESRLMHVLASQWFGSRIGFDPASRRALEGGFGRIFEWVYAEESEGRQAAASMWAQTLSRYLQQPIGSDWPVIQTGTRAVADPGNEAVADKAALVLYQLGGMIGDEAWWRAVRDFAARGTGGVTTLGDLRESMEQASRRSLTRYFEQWFLEPGHPVLVVRHRYEPEMGVYLIRVRQVQDSTLYPLFEVETDVEINFDSRTVYREHVRLASRDTTLRFGVPGRVAFARLDEKSRLVAEVRESKPAVQWINQARLDDSVYGRRAAVLTLGRLPISAEVRDALLGVAEQDVSPFVRAAAIRSLVRYAGSPRVLRFLLVASRRDPSSDCRATALSALGESGDTSAIRVLREALADSSYRVVATAVANLGELATGSFWPTVEPLTRSSSWNGIVERGVVQVLSRHPVPAAAPFVRRLLEPTHHENVRLAALAALEALGGIDPDWREAVRVDLQRLLSDRNARVRSRARQILRARKW